jgi:hypothetical protein
VHQPSYLIPTTAGVSLQVCTLLHQ